MSVQQPRWPRTATATSGIAIGANADVGGLAAASHGIAIGSDTDVDGEAGIAIGRNARVFNGVTAGQNVSVDFGRSGTFEGIAMVGSKTTVAATDQDGYISGNRTA